MPPPDRDHAGFFLRVLEEKRGSWPAFVPIFERGDVALILDEKYETCPHLDELRGEHPGPIVHVPRARALTVWPELHDFIRSPAAAKIVVATHGLYYSMQALARPSSVPPAPTRCHRVARSHLALVRGPS
jgi:hypothetical protein